MHLEILGDYAVPQGDEAKRHLHPVNTAAPFDVYWAHCEDDVRTAQRLRYRVFAQDMGARLYPPVGTPPGLDADAFDPFCDHLLVRAVGHTPGRPGPLLGTCRVLAPAAARRACGLYTDTEFDLRPLQPLRTQMLEMGRCCVHPAWRSGAVIMAIWSALGQYMQVRRLNTLLGCASIGLADGGMIASNLWRQLRLSHMAATQWQVRPRAALPLLIDSSFSCGSGNQLEESNAPPLLKAYLRCGARVLGAPAHDADFNTADLPMMLQLDEITPRYRRRFLGI
jgi:putative hemolysin